MSAPYSRELPHLGHCLPPVNRVRLIRLPPRLRAESFNQDISAWDTSTVETMSSMFLNAQSFDQDISAWCVEQITQKLSSFDEEAGFEGVTGKRPDWGDAS